MYFAIEEDFWMQLSHVIIKGRNLSSWTIFVDELAAIANLLPFFTQVSIYTIYQHKFISSHLQNTK